jgi:hypothetical protein
VSAAPDPSLPDLDALTLPELVALGRALGMALAAAKAGEGGAFDCALMADAEGVSVTFTIPVVPAGEPVPPEAGTTTTNLQP